MASKPLLNIVDIATSVMRGVSRTLSSMCNINLEEIPSVRKEDVSEARIFAPEGVYTTYVVFTQTSGAQRQRGGIVIYVSKSNVKTLFGGLGVEELASDSDIKDICAEFCNIVAGVFKTEIVRLGYEDVQLSIPEKYFGNINEPLGDLCEVKKYKLSFAHNGVGVLSVDVFMERTL